MLTPSSPAAFELRYVTSQAPATAACSLSVAVNGSTAATDGTIPLAACASITDPPPAAVAACAAQDLALREVRTAPAGELASNAVYALQNRGVAPCRIVGPAGIRLFDANGTAFALRFAVRNVMAMLLTLPPGYEASFVVSYVPHAPQLCPVSASITVYLPAQTASLTAPATLAACTGSELRVGNLRLGIPLPAGLIPD